MKSIPRYQWALLGIFLIPCWVIALKFEVDIKTVYHVAHLTATGEVLQAYRESPGVGRFFYGPITTILWAPLGFLPFAVAKGIWIALQTLSFGIVFWGLYQFFPLLRRQAWPFLWLFSFALNPIHNNFQSNNIQLMLLAVLWLAEWASRQPKRGWQVSSGVLVAVAAAVKVFPGFIALFYLWDRNREIRKGIVGGLFLSLVLPFLFFGLTPGLNLYQEFIGNLGSYETDNSLLTVPDILCLPSLLARLGAGFGVSSETVFWMTKAVTFLLTGGFLFSLKLRRWDRNAAWALALILMTLLNPSTRVHYFVFYLPAFAYLLSVYFSGERKGDQLISLVLSWGLLALTVEGIVGKELNNRLEFQSWPTWGAILLGMAVFRSSQGNLLRENL